MVLSKDIKREGYVQNTSARFGELNILYENSHSVYMIEWINKSVVMIKDRLNPDSIKALFTTTPFSNRPQLFDINSNRLRSYVEAVNQQYGNPQDNNLTQSQ